MNNLINIIESKKFNNTYYKQFILTEQDMNPQMQRPNNTKAIIGTGLVAGAGVIAAQTLKNNPQLQSQLNNAVNNTIKNNKDLLEKGKEITTSVTSAVKNTNEIARDKAELYKHTHFNTSNASPEEVKSHATWLASQISKMDKRTPTEQREIANAYNNSILSLKKLSQNGNSDVDYSKDFNPLLYKKLNSQDVNDLMLRRNIGDKEGTLKDWWHSVSQSIGHVKESVANSLNIGS